MRTHAPTEPFLLGPSTREAGPSTTPAAVGSESKAPRGLRWRTCWALIALPAILLAILIAKYGVDCPHYDEWVAVAPLFERMDAGTLRLGDFFALHNEHRHMLPRMVLFTLGRLTHWNVRAESFLTLFLFIGLAANCWQLLRTTGWRPSATTHGLFLLMSLLIFSTVQHENLLWGFQSVFVMAILFVAAGCWLTLAVRAPWNFPVAMALATASTFSIASGFVCWLVLAPLLLVTSGRGRGKWWAGYGLAFAANLTVYFATYQRPAELPTLKTVLADPWLGAQFLCTYVGAPFSHGTAFSTEDTAQGVGAILLTGLAAATLGIWRRRQDFAFLRRALPWLMIAGFGLANAAITTVGRAGFGLNQALESRYSTYALLIPMALLPLGALFVSGWRRRNAHGQSIGGAIFAGGAGGLLLLLLLSQLNWLSEWNVYRRAYLLEKALVQTAPWVNEPRLLRSAVTPNPATFRQTVSTLDRLGYLRPPVLASPLIGEKGDESSPGDRNYGALEQARKAETGETILIGWAILPDRAESAHAVLLTCEHPEQGPVIFAVAPTGVKRGDVVRATGEFAYQDCGWAFELTSENLPPEPGAIKAWAYDAERRRAWRLPGQVVISPPPAAGP
jgi:hypothetical protein